MASNYNPASNSSGLILCLDAGNTRSYPGTGTTWSDLSGKGQNVTLNAACAYTATKGGGIVFNGSTAYGDFAVNNIFAGSGPFTFESFFYNISSTGTIINNYGPGYTTNSLWFFGGGMYLNTTTGYITTTNYSMINGTHHILVTRDGSGYFNSWFDGVQYVTNGGPNTASVAANINWRVGADVASGLEQFNGHIYLIRAYNVALSSAQILQNFNALRGRFGL